MPVNAVPSVAPIAITTRSQASAKARPAPTQVPFTGPDDRFRDGGQRSRDRVVVPVDDVHGSGGLPVEGRGVLGEILADAGRGAGPGEYHRAHLLVGVDGLQRVPQPFLHLQAQGRAGEDDDGDGTIALDGHGVGVRHHV
jgi:hypothetical protein